MIKRILKSCLTLTRIWWKLVVILLVPLLYSPLLFVSGSDPAKATYGIFIIGTYWVANVAPLAATALLPVFIFPLLKLVGTNEISQKYFTGNNLLYLGGLFIAVSVEKWNLHRRIAFSALLLFGSQPRRLLLGFMLVTGFLSMWISNTAVTAFMVPIAQAVLVSLNEQVKAAGTVTSDQTLRLSVKFTARGKESEDPEQVSILSTQTEDEENADADAETGSILQDSSGNEDASRRSSYRRFCKALMLGIAYSANIGGTVRRLRKIHVMATCSPADRNSPLSNTEKDSSENVIDSTTNVSAESENFKTDERYSYTEREGFTSEVNKVEINNIPRICGYKQLKSFFKRYKLTPLKLKIVRSRPKHSFAFATFHTPEEKQLALERMNGEMLKGQKLLLKPAKPRSDPFYSKTTPSTPGGEPDPLPSAEEQAKSLLRAVTPLWDVPYSEQLVRKSADLKQSLDKIKKELERMRNRMQDIPMDEIRGSAPTDGYRNKNEFTCGKDLQGRKCVGFRLGAYKKGSWTVASPDVCIHVPREVLHTVQRCNQFICTSHLDVFDPRDHSGHWKQITVRSNQEGEQLLIIQVYSQGVSREEVREECDKLCMQLESPADSDTDSAIGGKIASVYFQLSDSVNIGGPGGEMELLRGDRKLKETLLGVKFCISPNAFFQVNTPAAETLYDVIRENVQASPDTVLLDLCCGTGTIGLCLAGKVGRVVGVDLCQGAIEDAVSNAELNGITNTEFLCGAVETVIHTIPEVAREECQVVAVLDPPRAGVPAQVISTLRKAKNVKRLIYVSCNVSNASQNLVDLCRPPSSRIGGNPFSLCKVTPVDLFPHTMHCELVLCYDHVS